MAGCATSPPALEPPPRPTAPPPVCAVESPTLCLQDGIDLWVGNHREVDRDAAQSKFELACTGGSMRGCTFLGIALVDGDSLERARAFDLFGTSCEAGESMACARLGTEYLVQAWVKAEQTGEPQTAAFVAANEHLRRACIAEEEADAREVWGFSVRGYACGNLAASYEHGFAVPQDYTTAMELNQLSCELGWTRSCAQIGYFYEVGLGVAVDRERAVEIYDRACEANDAMACYNLGLLVQDRDAARAKRALEVACQQQYPGACEARTGTSEGGDSEERGEQ